MVYIDIIPAEIYPTPLRAKAESVLGVFNYLAQILSIYSVPYILELSGGGSFFLFGSLLALFLTWGFIFIPETKGIKLEDMDEVFKSWRRWKKVI